MIHMKANSYSHKNRQTHFHLHTPAEKETVTYRHAQTIQTDPPRHILTDRQINTYTFTPGNRDPSHRQTYIHIHRIVYTLHASDIHIQLILDEMYYQTALSSRQLVQVITYIHDVSLRAHDSISKSRRQVNLYNNQDVSRGGPNMETVRCRRTPAAKKRNS